MSTDIEGSSRYRETNQQDPSTTGLRPFAQDDKRGVTFTQDDKREVTFAQDDKREVTFAQDDKRGVTFAQDDKREVTFAQDDKREVTFTQDDKGVRMNKIKLSSMVAISQNHVIGKDNELLWHIPKDFKHFKRTTMGKPMVMGRKTYDSLPGPLKGRVHIVVSRSADPAQDGEEDGTEVYYRTSLEDGIALGREIAARDGVDEAFIVGGGEIYRQTMDIIDRLYLTVVHQDYEGDTHFPEFDWGDWENTWEEKHEASSNDGRDTPAFTFYQLERI